MEFYSHLEPEIILKDHLRIVGDKSKKIIESKKFDEIDKGIISDVSYLIGISHDFGKYTTYFQEKLKGRREKNDPLTYHGLISALFVFEIVKEYLKIKIPDNEIPYNFLPLIAYFVVKRHHLNLDDIEDDIRLENLFKFGFKQINNQLENIWKNKNQVIDDYKILIEGYLPHPEKIFDNLETYKKEIQFSDDIKPLISELNKSLYFFKNGAKNIIYYLLVQLFYSVLIDSDKKHAGQVMEIKRKELPESLVENYLNSKDFKESNESNINLIRYKIRKSVLKNISDSPNNQKIFTLTAPTGTGKTLTSLSVALVLRKKLKIEMNLEYEPRIIYSLPFTSIIDQNFAVFDRVLSQIEDFKENESVYLLKHHHLSEIFYNIKDKNKENDIDQSLALIESWESEVVVTTFIQLFYTLIGYKNRSLKKFHNIVNSIIILDEVQNIPIEYWKLTQEILTAITRYFNCRIILMTATKPLIFEDGTYKELVDDYEDYFKNDALNRVCLNIDSGKKRIEDFCNELNDWSKNSYLFVFNTIESSLDFYEEINKKIEDEGLIFKLCYLSTNIIPKDRKKKIERIKQAIDDNEKIIVVSTQLIEAGVDIDCECVYRDLGPLDSIIQVAGRCNRNKRLATADVYLVNLIKENGKTYTGIYDHNLLNIVNNILKDKKLIYETEFLDLINQYFSYAKKRSGVETKLIDSIYELYFDKNSDNVKRRTISEFELIKEDFFKIDIFIELDEIFVSDFEITTNTNIDLTDLKKKYEEETISINHYKNKLLVIYDIEKITRKDLIKEIGAIIDIKELKTQTLFQKYQEIKNLSPLDRKKEFLKIKKQFYDYVISVSKYHASGFNEKELGFVSHDVLESYYDKETGFKREKAGCGNLIC
ncbi:CRISPR-associated nuclease/helicase Cas3 [uncultured archaeon]|nr:CRISPR-associated nuclease/helicase Cas3 [uncultured archaeon]